LLFPYIATLMWATERSDNAAMYGFGEAMTMYDNVLVLGDVRTQYYSRDGVNHRG